MCGRFTLRSSEGAVAEEFGLLVGPESGDWRPRYNIAPSQPVAVVRASPVAHGAHELVRLRWGLIPAWAKDAKIGNRLINARADSIADKPAFRAAFRRRRCLVVADGFYEWRQAGKQRQPYFVHLQDDRPFAFAGLWESWEGPAHAAIESCTIVTTDANDLLRPIHDRMPVVLAPADCARWLDPAVVPPESLAALLRPYPSGRMQLHAVGPLVNSPTHDDPRCVEPI
jgi:putative SOS response-associated peptidase YedK